MVITSRSSGARNLIRMQSCAWYLEMPGTTRTEMSAASFEAAGFAFGSPLPTEPSLAPDPGSADLPEPPGPALGTVVPAGFRAGAAGLGGGLDGTGLASAFFGAGSAGLATGAGALSAGAAAAGGVPRASAGRSAARERSGR